MPQERQDIAELMRSRGLRATPQRVMIYDALNNAGSHPTAAAVHEVVRKHDPTVSLATVYKALELFSQVGLAQEMGFRGEGTRYDPRPVSHVNLICSSCHAVDDYTLDSLKEVASRVYRDTGFRGTSERFEIHGLCSRCRSLERSSKVG